MIGGAEVQVRIVAEGLTSVGHEVSVASRQGFEHPRIRSLDSRRLLRSLSRRRPELVVSTVSTRTAVAAALASRLLGLDFVYRLSNTGESELLTGREIPGPRRHRLVFYLMLRYLATRIWCQHGVQRENLERRRLGGKLFVGANLAPDRRQISPGRETVLWVGRFDRPKRPELFPPLARRLAGRRCVMVVPGAPSSFRESLAGIDNLELLDWVSPEELPAYYARARVLVNTSSTEGLPNTFVEAACQGTPIVTAAVDPGDYFARYGHGLTIEDPDALARKIEELFAAPDLHRELSRRARRYFEEVHELERNFPRLSRELLGGL